MIEQILALVGFLAILGVIVRWLVLWAVDLAEGKGDDE